MTEQDDELTQVNAERARRGHRPLTRAELERNRGPEVEPGNEAVPTPWELWGDVFTPPPPR